MAGEFITSETSEENGWTLLVLTGRLDRITSSEIEEKAESLLAKNSKFAIDVKGLSYLSSAGIRILIRVAKKARSSQKSFAICGAEGFVKEVMDDSNLDAMMTIYQERGQLG